MYSGAAGRVSRFGWPGRPDWLSRCARFGRVDSRRGCRRVGAGGDLALRRCVFRSESTGVEAPSVGSDIWRGSRSSDVSSLRPDCVARFPRWRGFARLGTHRSRGGLVNVARLHLLLLIVEYIEPILKGSWEHSLTLRVSEGMKSASCGRLDSSGAWFCGYSWENRC